MPSANELLRPNEDLMLDTHPHWWFIVPASAILAGVMLLGVIIFVNKPGGLVGDVIRILSGASVLAALGYFASRYASWVSTNFVVTSERIMYRSGVFAKSGMEIPVDKVNAVHFSQNPFERLLKLGDLIIESASESGSSEFDDIPHPSSVREIIYGVMQEQRTTSYDKAGEATARALKEAGLGGGGGGAGLSVAEQLEKLHELVEQGALTPEEYEAQKARLLGG